MVVGRPVAMLLLARKRDGHPLPYPYLDGTGVPGAQIFWLPRQASAR